MPKFNKYVTPFFSIPLFQGFSRQYDKVSTTNT